mmetsp:Transcript_34298/g.49833  ORF Transcript_34298/g.49833 Transcript_34298/m.49833 type:complete len:84 (-) Transcript_34298:871-1122(-)
MIQSNFSTFILTHNNMYIKPCNANTTKHHVVDESSTDKIPLVTGKLGELVGFAECVGEAEGETVGGPIGWFVGVLLGYEDGAG